MRQLWTGTQCKTELNVGVFVAAVGSRHRCRSHILWGQC